MERRAFLAHIGAGSLLGLAGCINDAVIPEERDGEAEPANRAAPGDKTGSRADVQNSPGGLLKCPPHETTHGDVVCSHTADPDATLVYLEAHPSRGTLVDGMPAEKISLTLHNRSTTGLTFNPHSWTIRRQSNSKWQKLRSRSSGDGRLTVSPGDSKSWSLQDVIESIREDPDLKAGTYTAEIGVPNPETDAWVSCIAIVQLEHSGDDEAPSNANEGGDRTLSGMSEDGNDTTDPE